MFQVVILFSMIPVRLCYNGTLEESVKGVTLPQAADCISKTDAKCHADQSTASNLGFPTHMQVIITLFLHGHS